MTASCRAFFDVRTFSLPARNVAFFWICISSFFWGKSLIIPHSWLQSNLLSGIAGAPHSLGSTLSGFAGAPHNLGSAYLLSFHTSRGEQLLSVLLGMFKIRSPPNIQHNQNLIHQNELLATQWMFFVWIIAALVNCLKSANLQETFAINWFFSQTLPW